MSHCQLNFLSFLLILQLFRLTASTKEVEPRIIGGYECKTDKDTPFVVTVLSNDLCGGSLLTMSYVLTAAHCLGGKNEENKKVKVRTGFAIYNRYTYRRFRHQKKYFVHPKYDKKKMNFATEIRFDIGIIQVTKPFIPSPYTKTVSLPQPGFSCKEAVAAGVGKMSNTEEIDRRWVTQRRLQCVKLALVDSDLCKKTFPRAVIDDSIICTYWPGKDTCSGDSGGPLFCKGVILGIVSIGTKKCATEGRAAAFTKVEKYLDFIESIVPLHQKEKKSQRIRSAVNRKQPWKIFLVSLFWFIVGR